MATDNLVEIRNVRFAYGERPLLTDITLDIPRGKGVGIMGSSGCGKSTLLRLIGGQLYPQAGTVKVAGEDVHKLSRDALYRLRRKMGMQFQQGGLFTDLTVFENIAFQMREHTQLPESMIRDLVAMKLASVGLRGTGHLMPAELSGGMARRVGLARAIALDHEISRGFQQMGVGKAIKPFLEPFTDSVYYGVDGQVIKRMSTVAQPYPLSHTPSVVFTPLGVISTIGLALTSTRSTFGRLKVA